MSNRFGSLTSVRYPGASLEKAEGCLRQALSPATPHR